MSHPSTCPFCGAATEYTSAYHTGYKCWTLIRDGQKDPRESQSFPCVQAERERLQARVSELERQLSDFRAGEMVTAPPVAGERHPRPSQVGDDVNSQGGSR